MHKKISNIIGTGKNGERHANDFYPTPDYVTQTLLAHEKFNGEIWEPACGQGHMAKVLESHGYTVKATDLVDYGYGIPDMDFLKQMDPCDNIVTNPPFNISTKFTLHALALARQKVAIFNKLTFLEGKERKEKLFSQKCLKSVYIFSNRINFDSNAKHTGMLAFAWYVFDKSHKDDPKLFWV